MDGERPSVGIIMGSASDWEVMRACAETLLKLGIPNEARVISAHRTPDRLIAYVKGARDRGLKLLVTGAGLAAGLPGMVAAMTPLPVLGVPLNAGPLQGIDALFSIVQMPGGVPVATFAIGRAGAVNAAVFAASMLALSDTKVAAALDAFREAQTAAVPERPGGA